MAKKNPVSITGIIDCACVIHGQVYDWIYVERLYNMLRYQLSPDIRFHVYTEPERPVPAHMIRHDLISWPGVIGPRKSWWYKLQLFDARHHTGNLLYLDLDTVLVSSLDWIRTLDPQHFWAIRDFKYLQRLPGNTINSSMMWWNVSKYQHIWHEFNNERVMEVIKRFPGDQDYLSKKLSLEQLRFFDDQRCQSYRWQCLDGGYDFKRRRYNTPGSGVSFSPETSVMVFHGHPKPHEITDPLVANFWHC